MSACVQRVKHFRHAHPIIIHIANFVPLIHQYVQWSPNTITLFFMWDVIWRGFSINCFSGLSDPSIFLVLLSRTLTHCIIYSVFSTYIAKGKIPHLLHLSCTKVTCSDCRTVIQAPVPTSKRTVSTHKSHKGTKAFMSTVLFLSNLNRNQNMLTHFSKYLKYDKSQKFICKSPCSMWMNRRT